MITFDVKLEGTQPQINVTIPMGDYLLDEKQLTIAKETIQGIQNLCRCSYDSYLFINNVHLSTHILEGIVENHRSLYLLKLLDDVLQRVKPINDPVVNKVIEKVEPVIERAKLHVEFERDRERY